MCIHKVKCLVFILLFFFYFGYCDQISGRSNVGHENAQLHLYWDEGNILRQRDYYPWGLACPMASDVYTVFAAGVVLPRLKKNINLVLS